ncbi:Ger(x)C family spore germination protein [Bacillus cereus]|uniref:Ger(x)C family spore germination protein n=1 Tax=Bacillus TaxID=1386 RepID=UPI0024BB2A7B|nr:Ger(x)C family spore germination protein [Bacillus cereus]WHS75914.1 Ger(x)C family spore germination protein [Bacillus cereus]
MKILKWISISCLLLCCSGCWDQHIMKDIALVTAIAYDQQQNEKIQTTFFLPRVPNTNNGISKPDTQVVSVLSNTPSEGKAKLDAKISGLLDTAKNRVLLIGESFAKKSLPALLDSFYLDPKSNLRTPVVVVKGNAKQFMKQVKVKDELFSDYMYRILQSAKTNGLIEETNIQGILSKASHPKQDFVLPYMEVDTKQMKTNITGLALFHNNRYTGQRLKKEQAKLYVLLQKQQVKNLQFTQKIRISSHSPHKQYVTIQIKKRNKYMAILPKQKKIHVNIRCHLQVALVEKTVPTSKQSKEKIEKELSHLFTKQLRTVLQTLQKENCDSLGIRRELQVKHPQLFQATNGKQQYAPVKFSPTVHVQLVDKGLIQLSE